jgi:predicted regulator of Ras-like GTPase activity (Roadblock/LC7/MglB family)
MDAILEKLGQATGVIGCFITGMDGLVVAGTMREGREIDLLAATVADLYHNVQEAFQSMDGSLPELVTIERPSEKVFIQYIEGADTLLVVLTVPKVNLGLVRMEIQQAAQKLKSQL